MSLTVRDSLFRGRSGAVTTTAQMGGCIFTAGDGNRVYGQNGVGQNGSVASNRASVTLQRVALVDCDVQQAAGAPGSGVGGGLMTTMTALTLQDSLVSGCDAIGTDNASGGGLALIDQTAATITNTLIAKNTSTNFGGGLFAQGRRSPSAAAPWSTTRSAPASPRRSATPLARRSSPARPTAPTCR
ncbi:MAG: hypothetical protein U0802_14780 [Candidatus Binatia bacterium]